MSPAKATRPGFRQSMGANADSQGGDQTAINLFHPVYHGYTYPIGCRIDVERLLPVSLDEEDEEELIDSFSEPPVWVERFSPLAVQIGEQIVRGKNATDLMLRVYRMMFELFAGVGRFIESTIAQSNGEEPVRYPFMSLCVDPDSVHRLIESDYESGEAAYSNLMKLFRQGTVSPCLTTPFHTILPLLESEAEIRICVRSAFIFYLRLIRIYAEFLKHHGEDGLIVMPFWLPESGYSRRVAAILEEEFHEFCRKEKLGNGHLVIMLDNHQADYSENDVLMKSWNQLAPSGRGNGRNGRSGKGGAHGEPGGTVSVVFRDRSFSDWVIHANPSVKKLLDRTIAKVDSDINTQNVHYGWAHFEELEAITYTPRSIVNFQQKLIKLIELSYLPLSPDFYIRGKLRGEFGCTKVEPQTVELKDASAGNGWDLEHSKDMGRWLGVTEDPAQEGQTKIVARPYERQTAEGKVAVAGNACWKVAWTKARQKCYQAVVGNLESMEGGMAEVLAGLTGQSDPAKVRRNVVDFLSHYTYVYWREHFIQHDLAEADINILELTRKYLRAGSKGEPSETDAAIAGGAAQAIYFALDSGRSVGAAWENMDQRAFYQNVAMLTLSLCTAIYVYHWQDDQKGSRKLLALLKSELLDFQSAYDRYDLAALGVTKKQWADALRSEIEESKDNVVKRAALRVAARQLRPLGYTKDFTRADANLTTNVGHIWSIESCRENFCYENALFCGVNES